MTHASLCKKTYGRCLGLQGLKFLRLCLGGIPVLIFLFLSFANGVYAQCNEGSFAITTTSIPNPTLDLAYSVQLQTTGAEAAPNWFLASGNLPPGLELNSNNGTISGTPTAVGNYTFTVEAEYNMSAPVCATQTYSVSVTFCRPNVSPTTLSQADVNLSYQPVYFMESGCPSYSFTYSLNPVSPFNNNLPPGLSITSQGVFSGTPTTAGTYQFLLTLTDQNNDQTEIDYSIVINPLPTITTSSPLPSGPVDVPYSQQIAAKGGVPPYTFHMAGNVPGISITTAPDGSHGILSGTPTQSGTFDLLLSVSDSLGGEGSSRFQVTFGTATAQITASPSSITFNSDLNGAPPPTQVISVLPSTGALPPVTYTVVVDNGQNGGAAPSWITVSPQSGSAPVSLVVSANQSGLIAGSYPARVQVIDSNGLATDVAISLNVASQPQQLQVASSSLNFAARSAAPGILSQELVVSSAGAGSLAFTTSVVNKSPWITSVTAASNSTSTTAPVFVLVQVNTTGLAVGSYNDAIQFSSSAGNVLVPVSLFVAESGPILALDTTGVLVQAIQGGGSTATQTIKVLNLGDPSSTVNWTATLVSGSNWLSLVNSSGTATSTTPGTFTLALAPNATQLTAGPYYAIVKVAASNSNNPTQYITAVLNLGPSSAAAAPYLTPGGLFFTTPAGTTAPAAQNVQVNTSSASSVTFNASTSTADGATWLNVTPTSGNASGQTAGSISVSVDPTGLNPGIYSGDVSVSIGALLESVNVTFVVQSAGSSNAARPAIRTSTGDLRPKATGCTPSKLAITETGLPNNFSVPAGWPATLIVQLNDDCADAVTSGSVIASFSNGDGPLTLVGDNLGNYSATWQPSSVNANMVVTLNATSGSLQPAVAKLYGGVGANQTPAPSLFPNGTVNNFNPVAGAGLSPGTIAQVYGTGLAASTGITGEVPWPSSFNNIFALIGPTQAPLYYLSPGQLDILVPNDATATQQTPIVLSVNNALTLPLMLNIVPAAPGVLSYNDGATATAPQNGAHIKAQHADGSLVTSTSPAKPGEYLVMYLIGMGGTNPSITSGTVTPTSPLSKVTVEPTVTVDGTSATVTFAGLTPGYVGLYQIDFQVPTGAMSGDLEVDVSQNGVAANPTLLPVSN